MRDFSSGTGDDEREDGTESVKCVGSKLIIKERFQRKEALRDLLTYYT